MKSPLELVFVLVLMLVFVFLAPLQWLYHNANGQDQGGNGQPIKETDRIKIYL